MSTLVAGIGNLYFGDDAFGGEVARRLLAAGPPPGVRVVDFGIRGFDLVMALLEPFDTIILVDATRRGGPPGSLYVLELDGEEFRAEAELETHRLVPEQALRTAASMGACFDRLLLVGCEPAVLGTEDEPVLGLSEPVRAAIGPALALIEELTHA